MTDVRAHPSPTRFLRLKEHLAGRYALERELGRGGSATVYLAHDLRHDRRVALKVLQQEPARSLGAERFLREIRLSARLQHPHILPVLDSGDADGELWFAMPFVDGETLRQRLNREQRLPVEDALRIAREVADALDYAHRFGVIHRDIKPENILIGYPPRDRGGAGGLSHALVADFGIARALATGATEPAGLTETGSPIGTPYYMSPEQASGDEELDPSTDVYSLGCVLYELLAGEPPLTGPNMLAVLARRVSEAVPPLGTSRSVPPQVQQIVTRALGRTPAERFGSAAELVAALDVALGTLQRPMASWIGWKGGRAVGLVSIALLAAAAAFNAAGRLGGQTRGTPPRSAAVLPFTDLSPEKDQEYFSDGLTEELITALSQVENLRVAARTSSFQYKHREADIRDVGRRLDVGAVLEGSVRRSGNHVRISAQLVNVKDGYQLWADSYDRSVADIFAVQEDIARAIVSALRMRLGPERDSMLAAPPTRDVAAYELYLRGRFALNRRTEAALPEAARYFEQAVGRDSTFARAYAGLADAYILLPLYAAAAPGDFWPKAKHAAQKALALDARLAEAHTSLAYGTMLYEWDWNQAEAGFRRAIAADPAYATAHHWYGDYLAGRGRLDESLSELQRAHELDPLSRIIGVELGWVYYLQHRTQESEEQIERTLELDPTFAHGYFTLALARIQAGRYGDAIASLNRGLALGGYHPNFAAVLCYAYAASGDQTTAKAVLKDMQRRSRTERVPPHMFAVAYTGLGDVSRAIGWLNEGIDRRDNLMPETFFDPLLDPLRSDPRFAEVERRMGVAARPAPATWSPPPSAAAPSSPPRSARPAAPHRSAAAP